MRLLIVDDNTRQRELLQEIFENSELQVTACGDSREALLLLENGDFDTVITDLKMPHISGTDILKACRHRDRELPVIIITGYGSVDSAIEAMKIGAYDYIEKPFDPEELSLVVKKAIDHYALVKKNREMAATIASLRTDELIGASVPMQAVRKMIERVSPLDVPVLIQGETGTGKELVATMIHEASPRAKKKFLAINCGALNESILESELFGHEKGAFTGATRDKIGFFEAADGGTLFFDEINSMSPSLQVKLLRVLQEGSFLRVGGTKEIRTDVRIISATNADLKQEVEEGRFREDLYYRLHVMNIDIPPLRKRTEDIAELAYHFLRKCAHRYGKQINAITSESLSRLIAYPWPGNVRELENTICRAVIMEQNSALAPGSLPEEILAGDASLSGSTVPLMRLDEMEQFMIRKALNQTGGNKSQAAQLLGIDASTLWRKMKRRGLS
ncbi:MAG: sigma-54 dependent transcriptional regulator [Desulfobulbaceae bacterium]